MRMMSKKRRKEENEDLIRRMRNGEDLIRYSAEESWFPSRPGIAKKYQPKAASVIDFYESLCPFNCPYLEPKEQDQKENRIHWCAKYNQQVRHQGRHPSIVRLAQCGEGMKPNGNTSKIRD